METSSLSRAPHLTASGRIRRIPFSLAAKRLRPRGGNVFWRWPLALPLFAITLFVSAFLLFLVQPMIGKMILPKLGGTPQVWNTCMVFFQAALLVGYFYSHAVSTRLKLRYQLLVHGLILFLPLLVLLPNSPFNITGFVAPPGANPIPATLWLLTCVVGIPFLVVATSAPLLQK